MIYGLIGEKLSHSYSPAIHRIFFEITGMYGQYRLLEMKKNELPGFLKKAQKEYQGLNVTIPYKTDVIPFLDKISPVAANIGAVNTISLNSCLYGYNTDYYGIDYTMKKNGMDVQGMNVLITGSGGAAKALIAYLQDHHIQNLYVASRNPTEALKKFPGTVPVSYSKIKGCGTFDIIINTTPVGMFPHTGVSPLTPEDIKDAKFIFDLIYNPAKTRLLEMAGSLNIPNTNGLYMLVAQAVKAQEIWNHAEYGLEMVDKVIECWKVESMKENFR